MVLAKRNGVWHNISMREYKEIELFMGSAGGHVVPWLQMPIPCHEVTCRPILHRNGAEQHIALFSRLQTGESVDVETNR